MGSRRIWIELNCNFSRGDSRLGGFLDQSATVARLGCLTHIVVQERKSQVILKRLCLLSFLFCFGDLDLQGSSIALVPSLARCRQARIVRTAKRDKRSQKS